MRFGFICRDTNFRDSRIIPCRVRIERICHVIDFQNLRIPYRTNTPLRTRIGHMSNMDRIVFDDPDFLELVDNTALRENWIHVSRY